ncbi:hypothetical protein [Cupriavidus numazuensis]|uniref:Lipoprotein n=1 Tax=Cupriavidus numazuensis TaxID=221992 RepID=A0ABM8TL32_9BURK|nr:hypothetical protein [Cupriavidus numazuensis]CAG2152886.1 hypothetical protein LMG26411_04295 [Cupriavidus numazuensis]
MKLISIALVMVSASIAGCLHSPPTYPGAGGDNIDPALYVNSECLNLSGRYEGKGELLDGDATAQGWEKTRRLDNIFPFSSAEQVSTIDDASRSVTGRFDYPKEGFVSLIQDRLFQSKFIYPNGRSAIQRFSFEDKNRFVCTGADGEIIWGGASKGGRSEFGPNSSDSMAMLYLDEHGNLIYEKSTQIHMSMLLGAIPTGTAKYFAKYRFKRIR